MYTQKTKSCEGLGGDEAKIEGLQWDVPLFDMICSCSGASSSAL